jgi:predicted metal-dependent HD superfamily phosphohydrolase
MSQIHYDAASFTAWRCLLQRCGASSRSAAALFDELAAAYASPGRFYHTLEHVGQALHVVSALAGYARDAGTVRLAVWLHDVVYAPGAADNEVRSAALAQEWLNSVGLAPVRVAEVARLILLTAGHEADVKDGNGAVLLDADLAVLGAPPARYEAYAQAIRQEYSYVDDSAYRAGRARVLRHFLERPALYFTAPLRAGYEAQARGNLARELGRL